MNRLYEERNWNRSDGRWHAGDINALRMRLPRSTILTRRSGSVRSDGRDRSAISPLRPG
jgi:hypothetical protein